MAELRGELFTLEEVITTADLLMKGKQRPSQHLTHIQERSAHIWPDIRHTTNPLGHQPPEDETRETYFDMQIKS